MGRKRNATRLLPPLAGQKGTAVPHAVTTGTALYMHEGRKYWQCHRCRTQTTVTAGTIFHHTKLPLSRWFLAMHLMTQAKNNVSALGLKRHLGVRYKTAWLMKHKLLQVMAEREDRRVLDGRVEIDDAYLGGEKPGKMERGSENKISFVAAVQTTESGKPICIRLNRVAFTKEALEAWVNKALAASAQVISDGLHCFKAVAGEVASRTAIVTGSGRQAATHPEFHRVNTVLSNLKTAISGTYHASKICQICEALSCRSTVSFQSPLRSLSHSRQAHACCGVYSPSARANDQTG